MTVTPQETFWDGITNSSNLSPDEARIRHLVADSAKQGNWPGLLSILTKDPSIVNATRPDGKALYSPLHYAAYGGAPTQTIRDLLKLGAFRTLRDAQGNRPVDIAHNRQHKHLLSILDPVFEHRVRPDELTRIQQNFHQVILGRASELIAEDHMRLPELENVLEFVSARFWFAVPGMYGGFAYWIVSDGPAAKLMVESWSRACEGSGQRHEITESGSRLVEEGFV